MQPVNSAAWPELPVNNPPRFYLVLGVEIKNTSGFSRLCCSWEVVNPNDIVIFHSGTFYRNSLRLLFTTKLEAVASLGEFVQNKPHSPWFSSTFCFCYAFAPALPEHSFYTTAHPQFCQARHLQAQKTSHHLMVLEELNPRSCTDFIKSSSGLGWKGPWR